MVEDVDEFFKSYSTEKDFLKYLNALEKLEKKYPKKPVLSKDSLRKIFTNEYGKVHIQETYPRNTRGTNQASCNIDESGGIITVIELNDSPAIAAWSWEMYYNRRISSDSLKALEESEIIEEIPYSKSSVEAVSFKNIPFKWYKVTTTLQKDPFADESEPRKVVIGYVTLLDNRLFIRLSFHNGEKALDADVEKILQQAINWEWLKKMNLE
jgi:hypothetical protein